MQQSIPAMAKGTLVDLGGVFEKLPDNAADALIEAIVGARRIALYGAGREGLALRGFAMLFEIAETILFELAILKHRDRFGETPESLRARHTNLE